PQDTFKENNPFARTFRKGCYIDILADSYLSATHGRLIFAQTRLRCSLQHPLTNRRSYSRLAAGWSCAQMEWNTEPLLKAKSFAGLPFSERRLFPFPYRQIRG